MLAFNLSNTALDRNLNLIPLNLVGVSFKAKLPISARYRPTRVSQSNWKINSVHEEILKSLFPMILYIYIFFCITSPSYICNFFQEIDDCDLV